MDEYVIVIHPDRNIVLGVNERRPEPVYIIQIEERDPEINYKKVMSIILAFLIFMIAASSITNEN